MSRPFYRSLYAQVLAGILLGVILGVVAPETATAMKPLGDGFIKLIKMLIGPIVFATITVGIARMGAMRDVGRIGIRTLVYFEVISTLALVIGLVVVNILQPGAGLHVDPSAAPPAAVAGTAPTNTVEFLLNIIPTTVLDGFVRGDILQVLVVSLLFGVALLSQGDRAQMLVSGIDQLSHTLFVIVGMIMRLAPIGAFGAMAFTVGRYGIGSLLSLGKLMAGVYITCFFFILIVLGIVVRLAGLRLFALLRYIGEEILLVLGTSSSESALPRLMMKMEQLGCSKPVVGLVIPTGYSFNLDGTSIYMTMAAVFVAQASGLHLSLGEQLSILAILLLTSKGAAGVTGSGFITLAATLSAVPSIPPGGLALLVGVDRFMSEARAITNLIGNAVATVVIARWDGALDLPHARRVLGERDQGQGKREKS
ncbi:MAG TPA: dicarboxylate/amino acid:cation symporter [Vicinamibacterales bacterium]|nr:dicarboxylate/amino acid:cation symporter [Vicinamibacterales bacterium]